ncbi:MAG: hypothetical protein HRU76_05070 [Phycisphaeraceae bacterium]|nr:hypothetical protein [Phycisphaerales bacterium]QOJ16991.1 MAG: hypothetical protein HRU76_05070 [Phycisphaeraceae bacterium]
MKRKAIILGAGCLILAGSAYGQSRFDRMQNVTATRANAQAARDTSSKSHMLSVLLYNDITVRFDDTPARDAITFIQNMLGINVIGRYSDDRVGTGIDPEAPITLDVANKPALTVLEMVLEQCDDGFSGGVTWQLRDGFVEVGTKERLNAARELRIYNVRDLLLEPPMFTNAPSLDLDSAFEGGNGGSGGGGGGLGGGGLGGGGGIGGGGIGGGGFGGGGMGGGSGFGGGNPFETNDEDIERVAPEVLAEELIEIIVEAVEPEAWEQNGGLAATIRYYRGNFIVRAPDYVHRQLGGYPFAVRPPARRTSSAVVPGGRYVTMTGVVENTRVTHIDTLRFGGAAGGNGN